MDPITAGAMLSGGSSIISGILGSKANKENAAIARENLQLQREALEYAQEEAARQQAEAKLGQTDAYGNRTNFVEGEGWQTDLTLPQLMLMRAQQDEQQRQLGQETVRNERIAQESAEDRSNEGGMSDAYLRELQDTRMTPASDLRELFIQRGAQSRNDAADRAGEVVARQGLRTGGMNAAALTQGARAASDQASARQAGVDAEIAARTASRGQYAEDRNASSGLYDYFRRASTTGAMPVTGYTPTGPDIRSTAMADQSAIQAGSKAVQAPYTQPNLAAPDTLNDLGQLWMSIGKYNDNKELDKQILNNFGTPMLSNGYNVNTDRRGNTGEAF